MLQFSVSRHACQRYSAVGHRAKHIDSFKPIPPRSGVGKTLNGVLGSAQQVGHGLCAVVLERSCVVLQYDAQVSMKCPAVCRLSGAMQRCDCAAGSDQALDMITLGT